MASLVPGKYCINNVCACANMYIFYIIEFTEEPMSVNVLLNDSALFRCECVNCSTAAWHFNSMTALSNENVAAGVSVIGPTKHLDKITTELNVSMATESLNNSVAQCFIIYGSKVVSSGLAFLKCQGL